MWRARILGALALAGASVVLAAAPARAYVGPDPTPVGGTFTAPSGGNNTDGASIGFTAHWSPPAEATPAPTIYITKITITVYFAAPGDSPSTYPAAFGGNPTYTCTYNNPTAGATQTCATPSVSVPLNGTYSAQSSATGCNALGECNAASPIGSASVTVNVPPSAPTGLTVSYDDATRKVSLTWDKNTEPQIVDYVVERSVNGDTPSIIGTVGSPSYTDSSTGAGGTYTYAVATERAGTNGAVDSPPSNPQSVNVPAPPSPTTTAPGGGPDPGNYPPGGSTSTTTKLINPSLKPPSNYTPSKLDLSQFSKALNAAKAKSSARNSGGDNGAVGEADTGYKQSLPYGSASGNNATEDGPQQVADAPPLRASTNAKDNVRTAAAVAGGLLAIVLAMHGMWLRSEVKRAALLEPVEPEPTGSDEFRDFWFASDDDPRGG